LDPIGAVMIDEVGELVINWS